MSKIKSYTDGTVAVPNGVAYTIGLGLYALIHLAHVKLLKKVGVPGLLANLLTFFLAFLELISLGMFATWLDEKFPQ